MTNGAVRFLFFLSLICVAVINTNCNRESPDPSQPGAPPASADAFGGSYIGYVKRNDGTTELYKLELKRSNEEVSGALYFLSTLFDSIEEYAENPQKVDIAVFDMFSERPVPISARLNGNSLEFTTERLVVGNYLFTWQFNGQVQGDKLVGQLREHLENDEGRDQGQDQPITNDYVSDITLQRALPQ